MRYADFLRSPEGRMIAPLMADEAVIREMIGLSRRGRPAVEALDTRLAGKLVLDNVQRQHVGRWVRDTMQARGWRTRIQRRIADGTVFTSGTVYEVDALASAPAEALEYGAPPSPGPGRARETARTFSGGEPGTSPSYDGLPAELLPIEERIKRAQEIVRRSRKGKYSVNDFIRDKRIEAAREFERMKEWEP